MSTAAPQIGFDRFIQLDWAAAAIRVRAGVWDIGQLIELIDASHSGAAAKKKTRTVLNRLWLEPRPDLVDFADRGVRICWASPEVPISVLTWGMAITTYPFFGKVAEIVGRLTALQGDCASTEVHRRMAEIYGEREGTRRMTNMVLQSQANWGAIDRTMNGKRLVRSPPTKLVDPSLVGWIVEACIRYSCRPIAVASLDGLPIIFPFQLNGMLSLALSNATHLDLRAEGGREQLVDHRI